MRDHRPIEPSAMEPALDPAPGPTVDSTASGRRHRNVRLTRAGNDRVIAGVCGGIARWLGVDPVIVRIAFVVFAISGGAGVVAYVVLWVAVPDDRGRRGIDSVNEGLPANLALGRDRSQRALAVLLLLVGALLLLREAGLWLGDRFVWPMVLAALGLALAWPASAGAAFRRGIGLRIEEAGDGRMALVRVGLGVMAVIGGIVFFGVANADWHEFGDVALAVLLTIAGLLLIFGPWGWRLGRDLVEERRRRIRSEERAEVASRIHDSVLQTLALIQRRADDPIETARLARRQERELRGWLFGEPSTSNGLTLKSAMATAAAEVEDNYGVAVEVVTVSDAPLDDSLEALVAAAREAMVNAAKFAGVSAVDVYVEAQGSEVAAFVRDRGAGFDVASVPAGRQGIAESIRGRMARHGGTATVRSTPGHGTEVELVMPWTRA